MSADQSDEWEVVESDSKEGFKYEVLQLKEVDLQRALEVLASDFRSIEEHFDNLALEAKSILEKLELPSSDTVAYESKSKRVIQNAEWNTPGLGQATIEHFVVKILGHSRLSIAGTAAQIITTVNQIRGSQNREAILRGAYELGKLKTQLFVLSKGRSRSRAGGKRVRSIPENTVRFYDYLMINYPNIPIAKLFRMIGIDITEIKTGSVVIECSRHHVLEKIVFGKRGLKFEEHGESAFRAHCSKAKERIGRSQNNH